MGAVDGQGQAHRWGGRDRGSLSGCSGSSLVATRYREASLSRMSASLEAVSSKVSMVQEGTEEKVTRRLDSSTGSTRSSSGFCGRSGDSLYDDPIPATSRLDLRPDSLSPSEEVDGWWS